MAGRNPLRDQIIISVAISWPIAGGAQPTLARAAELRSDVVASTPSW